MAKAKAKRKRKSVPKPKITVEKFTKIVVPGKRIWEYLEAVLGGYTEKGITESQEREFNVATKGKYVLFQAAECDETFAIEKAVLRELVDNVCDD